MIYTEKGTIKVLNEEQSGTSRTGNAWVSREVVVETVDENILTCLHFKAFGRECEDLRNAKVGDKVEVRYKPQSREYNGRWYDEFRLFGIKVQEPEAKQASKAKPEPEPVNSFDDLPF